MKMFKKNTVCTSISTYSNSFGDQKSYYLPSPIRVSAKDCHESLGEPYHAKDYYKYTLHADSRVISSRECLRAGRVPFGTTSMFHYIYNRNSSNILV